MYTILFYIFLKLEDKSSILQHTAIMRSVELSKE